MEIKKLSPITTLPGIRRDGTLLDGDYYQDGQWVRFQRHRPKKMGGYQLSIDTLSGPVRETLVWSRNALNNIYSFSGSGIEMVTVDQNGAGAGIVVRTPVGFTGNTNFTWTADTLFNSAAGNTAVLACAVQGLAAIDDDTQYTPYLGDSAGTGVFTAIAGTGPSASGISGGVFCLPPYAVYYGSDGWVQWSDVNQPTVLTSGDAGSARPTGAKVVRGLPLRSGSGIAGLLWSLDSLIRMEYIGGQAIWRFTTISSQNSIMSPRSVIEYDGQYYWIGIDRFLTSNGGTLQELPNDMNQNWFFDNLNYAQRQKVWAMKIPRYGEIWWFYPRGDATECSDVIIYNVREKVWYDTSCARSAGYYSQVFHYPVMFDPTASNKLSLTLTVSAGAFAIGDNILGATSGALGTVINVIGTAYYVALSNPTTFVSGEGITNLTGSGTATITSLTNLYPLFIHEKGTDAVLQNSQVAIPSYFETCNFGYPTGGTQIGSEEGLNRWSRIVAVEPDFIQTGNMSLIVTGNEYANYPATESEPYIFTQETGKIDIREQIRHLRLRFVSDESGGFYEMGNVILWIEPGDVRS